MILCEKCSECFSPKDKIVGLGVCKHHGHFNFYACSPNLKQACPNCAIEYGICQKCGCNLKAEGQMKKTKSKLPKQTPTYDEMHVLLHRIYIARNITLDEKVIQECLKTIDGWFRCRDNFQ